MASRRDVLRSVGAGASVGPLARLGLPGDDERRAVRRSGDTRSLLFYNTWLIDDFLGIGGAPDRADRARAIGEALAAAEYDVAALCEAFADEERQYVRDGLGDFAVDSRIGPPSDLEKSSGLFTLVPDDGPTIVSSHRLEFETDGAEFRDAGAFSNKGVLHVELDFGPGIVDVYSTHLLAGGGLKAGSDIVDAIFGPPPPEEYRRRQVDELIEFVQDTRSPENPAIVAGDFNIGADSDEYGTLERMMDELDVYDAWTAHGGPAGGTNRTAIKHGCAIDPDGGDALYCEDREEHADVGRRIDYVFVSEPGDDHAVRLEVDEMRRRSFWRGLDEPGEFFVDGDDERPNYLADHLGLELQFRLEPGPGSGRGDPPRACLDGARCFRGAVSAGRDPGEPSTRRFTAPVDGEGPVRLRLVTDDDADLDLYVTLDGRTPTTTDYDRRSVSPGSDESLVVGAGELRDTTALAIAVRAYSGRARFTLVVEDADDA